MIKDNISNIEQKLVEDCKRTNRNRNDIKVIAVSKNNPVEAIEEAFEEGLTEFGENKAQELCSKAEIVKKDVNWHFIGHLQRNKAKNVVKVAEYIHSVDSIKLAKEIDKRAAQIDKIQKVLIEVNTSGEEAKFGLESYNEIFEIAEFCKDLGNIELVGLMTMAPYVAEKDVVRKCFIKLREIKEQLNKDGFNLTELSMGMTNDFEIAIEEGSTILRIGTALFGKRDYSKKWDEQ